MSDAAYAGIIDGTWWLPVLHGHDGVRLLTCWEPPGVPASGQRWASREQPPRPESLTERAVSTVPPLIPGDRASVIRTIALCSVLRPA